MKTRVFISYTSKDPSITEERLRMVETKLKSFVSVFIDRLHNKHGGQYRVNLELWRCDALIQLVSTEHQSEWVQKELMTARKKKKPVIKITIDDLLKKNDEDILFLLDEVEIKKWSVWSILTISVLASVGICFLGIWLSYLYVSKQPEVTNVMNARGVFGDSWGGVNAIISAFAFAGVIVTLFLQNRDLNLQRKEMTRQRLEFEIQSKTLKRQQFESALYNMLQLQQQIVNDLAYDTNVEGYNDAIARSGWNVVVKGRDVFRFAFEQLRHNWTNAGTRHTADGMRGVLRECGMSSYRDFTTPSYFDHYFRHLYRILKYIDSNSELSFKEKYKYVGDVRGTLSRYELVWIYYNLLSNAKFQGFKRMVEDYALLKNLNEEFLAFSKENEQIVREKGESYFVRAGFSGTDYEFFVTDVRGDEKRFYIGAFYNREEIDEGLAIVKGYKNTIESA